MRQPIPRRAKLEYNIFMASHYDSYNYASYWVGREYEDKSEKIALKKLLAKIPDKDSMIDIGGGFGRHSSVYAHLFKKCLLVEPSVKLLNQAKKNLSQFENIEFEQGSGENLPVKDEQFDAALMIRVAHHLPKPQKAITEAARILKPQGFLILEFANKVHFRALLRAWLKGNFGFTKNLESVDQLSRESKTKHFIPFVNHHPDFIQAELKKAGFKIIDCLSVSNFRHPVLKKSTPLTFLLSLESNLQSLFSNFSFGPSIFLLCQKI